MKKFLPALFLVLSCAVAHSQGSGTVPAGSVPTGLGPGKSGWGSIAPGSNGNCLQVSGGVWVSSACPVPVTPPAGTNGQIQYNNSGAFGGFTASGDATINTGTGVITLNTVSTAKGGTGSNTATNSPGQLLTPNGVNGNWVVQTLDVICTYTPSICSKIAGQVNIAWYSAVCNGSTDDTTAIQNAWNAAATFNLNVWLGGVGPKCKISTITMPTPVSLGLGGFGLARAPMLKGPGSTLVTLASTVTGSTCAINISATYGSNGSLQGSFEGFGVLQNSSGSTGNGICLTGITKATIRDVAVTYFANGIFANDTILLNIEKSYFSFNIDGIGGFFSASSNPNGWNIRENHFDNQQQYSIILSKPSAVNIIGNDFESNGTNSGLAPNTVYILGDPVGVNQQGVNVVGNYFEGNAGSGEVYLEQLSLVKGGVHNVRDNTFLRTLSAQGSGIFINNNAANTSKTVINITGNGFLDNLSTGAGYQWINVTTPATTNYTFICSGNTVSLATEINSRCGNTGVTKTMSSDANAQWVGFN